MDRVCRAGFGANLIVGTAINQSDAAPRADRPGALRWLAHVPGDGGFAAIFDSVDERRAHERLHGVIEP